MQTPWALYDALLADVPTNAIVEEIVLGVHWIVVRAAALCGVSMRYREKPIEDAAAQQWKGKSLAQVAELVKSWHFGEAALGLAAINAASNNPTLVRQRWPQADLHENQGAFGVEKEHMAGKKVAVIGGFPGVPGKEYCQISVLERRPTGDQLPDTACEYILPEQDMIFATGTTLINKTLPRLLALKGHSHFSLVGPSVPLHPCLYQWGVDTLSGVVIDDADKLSFGVRCGQCRQIFKQGITRVNLPRELLTV